MLKRIGLATFLALAFAASAAAQFTDPGEASRPRIIRAITCPTHTWIAAVSVNGTNTCTQPAFSDISGTLATSQMPAFGSGDVSCASGGGACTIANAAVTLAKQANLAANSLQGNNTGSPAAPLALTVAQVKTLLAYAFSDLSGSATCAQMPAFTGDTTSPAGSCVNTNVNLPTGVTMAGSLLTTEIAAPGTPAAGKVSIWTDSTDARFHDKNPAGTIGTTVVADTGTANNYISAISAAGVISKSRPTCSTLSDSVSTCNSLASPAFTGTPTAPTAAATTNTTQIATTAFVNTAVRVVKVQKFTASGTYTPSTGIQYAIIECVGGGGGGGGGAATAASTNSTSAGGGGGAYARAYVSAATIGASQTVTIGAAGAAPTAGNNPGGNGGTSSVGTLCSAGGGTGGAGSPAGTFASAIGGAGGSATAGDIQTSGGTGMWGMGNSSNTANGGGGGSSHLGGGGTGGIGVAGVGSAGGNYGGGGGGSATCCGTGAQSAGAGAAGIVVITEYTNQ